MSSEEFCHDADDFRLASLDAEDLPGILRGDAGEGARAVDTQRGERFQIRLNARAAAAVGAGDGQRDGNSFAFSHDRSIAPASGLSASGFRRPMKPPVAEDLGRTEALVSSGF